MKVKANSPCPARKPSLISVILSTYNAPLWLEKSLWGYANQTHTEFEVVIADDGSDSATREVIQRIRRQFGLKIKHVWHPDDGFRKCTILNRAIEEAAGDYLLFSDGDCIPRSDFVQQHFQAAEPGRFLSGGYFKLPMSISEQIDRNDIESGHAFTLAWLRAAGLEYSHRILRLMSYGLLAHCLNLLTTTRPTWNGHNASGWAEDVAAPMVLTSGCVTAAKIANWANVSRTPESEASTFGFRPSVCTSIIPVATSVTRI